MKTVYALLIFLLATAFGFGARAESPAAPLRSLLSFTMDFPVGFTSAVRTSGIGVYPINVVLPLRHSALTPYGSVGAAASIALASNENSDIAAKIAGVIVQPRIAIGARYVPVRGLTITTEVAYSPYVVEIVTLSPGGGVGSLFALSVGAEWL